MATPLWQSMKIMNRPAMGSVCVFPFAQCSCWLWILLLHPWLLVNPDFFSLLPPPLLYLLPCLWGCGGTRGDWATGYTAELRLFPSHTLGAQRDLFIVGSSDFWAFPPNTSVIHQNRVTSGFMFELYMLQVNHVWCDEPGWLTRGSLVGKLPRYGRWSWLAVSPSWQPHHHLNQDVNHIIIK